MAAIKSLGLALAVLLLLALFGVFYTVQEGQRGIVLQLGEIKTDSKGNPHIIDPGLHFKWPFINSVRVFDVRLRTMDVQSSRILTDEQKYVLVDYFAKWRVDNVPLFYTRTGGLGIRAETLLEQKINNSLRAEFGKSSISEVISGERTNIMSLLKTKANDNARELGITVVDVRIKRIDLPKEVSESVFKRMSTKRQQVATKHRSDGEAAANTLRAKADANVTVILANTRKAAAQLRAKGYGEAARIYAKAFSQDPDFYSFLRSMSAYEKAFSGKNDFLVLQPDGQFFRYFNNITGKLDTGKKSASS